MLRNLAVLVNHQLWWVNAAYCFVAALRPLGIPVRIHLHRVVVLIMVPCAVVLSCCTIVAGVHQVGGDVYVDEQLQLVGLLVAFAARDGFAVLAIKQNVMGMYTGILS